MPEYPKPPVPYAGYSDLRFATERQVRSRATLAGYDRGELSASPRRVTFRGMSAEVDCARVTSVRIVGKTFPLGTLLAVVAVSAALVYLNSPVPFTWRQPPVYIVSLILIIAGIRYWRERWVEVTYSDGNGERRAYFRREPIFWGSGAARTRQLYQDLQRKVLSDGVIGSDGILNAEKKVTRTPGVSK